MPATASVKRRLGEKMLMPIVAAGTSAAVGYVAKRAPGFVEDKVWPRVRDAAQGAGGLSEKLPAPTELTEELAERAKDLTGSGASKSESEAGSAGASTLSPDEISRRSEERARRRAARRTSTKSR